MKKGLLMSLKNMLLPIICVAVLLAACLFPSATLPVRADSDSVAVLVSGGKDTQTKGDWYKNYGADGYMIPVEPVSTITGTFTDAMMTSTGQIYEKPSYVSSVSVERAGVLQVNKRFNGSNDTYPEKWLIVPDGTTRISSSFASFDNAGTMAIDIVFSDNAEHDVAVYAADTGNWFADTMYDVHRTQNMYVTDANGNLLTDKIHFTLENMGRASYFTFRAKGHVKVVMEPATQNNKDGEPELSVGTIFGGIFFGGEADPVTDKLADAPVIFPFAVVTTGTGQNKKKSRAIGSLPGVMATWDKTSFLMRSINSNYRLEFSKNTFYTEDLTETSLNNGHYGYHNNVTFDLIFAKSDLKETVDEVLGKASNDIFDFTVRGTGDGGVTNKDITRLKGTVKILINPEEYGITDLTTVKAYSFKNNALAELSYETVTRMKGYGVDNIEGTQDDVMGEFLSVSVTELGTVVIATAGGGTGDGNGGGCCSNFSQAGTGTVVGTLLCSLGIVTFAFMRRKRV